MEWGGVLETPWIHRSILCLNWIELNWRRDRLRIIGRFRSVGSGCIVSLILGGILIDSSNWFLGLAFIFIFVVVIVYVVVRWWRRALFRIFSCWRNIYAVVFITWSRCSIRTVTGISWFCPWHIYPCRTMAPCYNHSLTVTTSAFKELKVNNQTAPILIKKDLWNALILHASITLVNKIN